MIDDWRKISVRAKDAKTDKLFDAFFPYCFAAINL